MLRGRDVASSNVPPCQQQKPLPSPQEKGGVESEAPCMKTSRTKQEVKLPGEKPASQPSEEKTPQGIAQVKDNTRQAAEADPTPYGGERQQG